MHMTNEQVEFYHYKGNVSDLTRSVTQGQTKRGAKS